MTGTGTTPGNDLAHNTRRMLQSLDAYWRFYEEDGQKMERWWIRYERYRKRVEEALRA